MASKRSRLFYCSNFVLIFLWVLTGGSVLAVFQRNLLLAVLFIYVVMLLIFGEGRVKKGHISAFIISLMIIVGCLLIDYFTSIKPQDGIKYVFHGLSFLVSGLVCVYFFSVFTLEEFQYIFFKVLRFIRWHALISAVLVLLVPGLFSMNITYVYTNYNAQSFLLLFFKLTKQFDFSIGGLSITRNQGLFWEPGVLQFYLNLLLFFELYTFKAKNIPIMLTIGAIISTYSTSAYLIMLVITAPALLRSIKRRPGIFLPLGTLMLSVFIPFFVGNLENKFEGEHQTSSAVRVFDVLQQVEIVKAHVLEGVGLDDDEYVHIRALFPIPGYFENPTESENAADRGSTNSIIFLLAAMGIPMGGLWLWAYVKQPFIKNKRFLIAFLLLVGVFVEPLLLKPFFMTFIIGGFMSMYYNLMYPKVRSMWKKNKVIASNFVENPVVQIA